MFCDVIEREDVTVTVTLQKHQLSTYRNLQLLDELIATAFKDPQGLAREKEQCVREELANQFGLQLHNNQLSPYNKGHNKDAMILLDINNGIVEESLRSRFGG